MAHVSVFYRWRLLGSLRDIAKGIGPVPEIAKDLYTPGGLRRSAYFIRHYIRLRFLRNRYNEPFYAVAITRDCTLWYLVREVSRIAARDQQREIYGIIAGPVEGFLRRLEALEQKWRKEAEDSRMKLEGEKDPESAAQLETNWRDLELVADELRAILGKEQPKH